MPASILGIVMTLSRRAIGVLALSVAMLVKKSLKCLHDISSLSVLKNILLTAYAAESMIESRVDNDFIKYLIIFHVSLLVPYFFVVSFRWQIRTVFFVGTNVLAKEIDHAHPFR